jgi:hypothetical protein
LWGRLAALHLGRKGKFHEEKKPAYEAAAGYEPAPRRGVPKI